jgi:membrane protease subunit HflK
MNEAIMREVVGDRTVTDILTTGRQEIAEETKRKLQELCDQYETGIVVEQIVLQDANPPDPVKPSFNEVNQAQQEKERMINDAWAEYNKVIPKAKGQALQTIQEARGYAADRINRAQGDARFFNEILQAYKEAPVVTRRRLYLEAMDRIYSSITRKILVDEYVKSILPMLSLDRKVKP